MSELDDEEKAELQRQREELERIQAEADAKAVLSSASGRRFVWRLLEGHCRLHSSSFTGESLSSAHAEGRRSVGVEVMMELQRVALSGYLVMVAEQLEALRSKPTE